MGSLSLVKNKNYNEIQRMMANEAYTYMMEHLDRHITIAELADRLSVSETSLKRNFRTVYGESVYAFFRKQKMHSAARMLESTDYSILYIAGVHGYTNASKFSSAFFRVMGMKPGEYKRKSRKGNGICAATVYGVTCEQ